MHQHLPHTAIGIVGTIVLVCSVLHSVLPSWEFLNDFPTAQKYYKVLIYLIGYIAVNARSSVHPSISTQDGTVQSQAAKPEELNHAASDPWTKWPQDAAQKPEGKP